MKAYKNQFPLTNQNKEVKMLLELKDKDGEVVGTMEFPLEEKLKEIKADLSDSSKSEAELKEKHEQNAQLKEQVAGLQEKAGNYDKLGLLVKSPEGFVEFAAHFGYDNLIPPATEAQLTEIAEDEAREKETKEEDTVLAGKTDKPGYEYLENLGISVKKDA